MAPNDIKNILPNPDKGNYEKIKKEHPYNILVKYAKAIGEKYPSKLEGIITESSDITGGKLLTYAFYFLAPIGNGYSYRLLELEPTSGELYPIKITIFETKTQELATVSSSLELEKVLQDIFKMGFTQTLILNLLSRVDLYKEQRDGLQRVERTFEVDGKIVGDEIANENKRKLKFLLTSLQAKELQELLFNCTPVYETTIMHTTGDGNIEIKPSINFDKARFDFGIKKMIPIPNCSIKFV